MWGDVFRSDPSIEYPHEQEIHGLVYKDSVSLTGVSVFDMKIGVVNLTTKLPVVVDGGLGLGGSNLSTFQEPSFVDKVQRRSSFH